MASILIVEDEIITAMAMGNAFKNAGHEICGHAVSGENALRQIEQKRPDVVLMDVSLRGECNGIDTANIVRSRWNIPVIFMTGYSDNKIIAKLKADGFAHLFIKPLDHQEILALIDSLLFSGPSEI